MVFEGREIDGATLYFRNQWHAKMMISHVLTGWDFFESVGDIPKGNKAKIRAQISNKRLGY
jgi:hypothetical protein